jgi:hypothetical protein
MLYSHPVSLMQGKNSCSHYVIRRSLLFRFFDLSSKSRLRQCRLAGFDMPSPTSSETIASRPSASANNRADRPMGLPGSAKRCQEIQKKGDLCDPPGRAFFDYCQVPFRVRVFIAGLVGAPPGATSVFTTSTATSPVKGSLPLIL